MTMNITKIVYAAGLVAQKLHKSQTDKGAMIILNLIC